MYNLSMNKKLIIIIVIVLIVIAGAFAYILLVPRNTATAPTPSAPTATSDSATATAPATAGVYTTYSADKLAQATGKRVLFFHAPWCPQCQALDKSILSSTVPAGVTIFKTDYDTNQVLRQKYGVTLQTTLVLVDDGGKLVKKYVAYDSPTFTAVKQNLGL